jgi:hypothetical protein
MGSTFEGRRKNTLPEPSFGFEEYYNVKYRNNCLKSRVCQ